MSNEDQKRLDQLANALQERRIAHSHVADSAGPEVVVSWRHLRLMVRWEEVDNGYDWQLLGESGQICAGSWRGESIEQIVDIIRAMVKEVYSYDMLDAHLHAVLISAGVPAIYEHTGGGCHNVEVPLTVDCYIIFGSDGGPVGTVGWSVIGGDFDLVVNSEHYRTPEELAPLVKSVHTFFALGS
jgi:hypothetical protein